MTITSNMNNFFFVSEFDISMYHIYSWLSTVVERILGDSPVCDTFQFREQKLTIGVHGLLPDVLHY